MVNFILFKKYQGITQFAGTTFEPGDNINAASRFIQQSRPGPTNQNKGADERFNLQPAGLIGQFKRKSCI